jgi:hypothetical protein
LIFIEGEAGLFIEAKNEHTSQELGLPRVNYEPVHDIMEF